MIKIFRRIRHNLIKDGNLRKYLLYAIGEILLVMIGIFLALQLNNWNNERVNRDKEISILKEMTRNLEMNMNNFTAEIETQESIIQNVDIVMSQIKNNIPYHDSLGIKYASIAWTEEFNIANSAFETLKTIGFDLISTDSVRERIINLFNVRYIRISDVIRKVSSADFALLSSVYIRHIEYDKQGRGVVNDFERLRKDVQFTNMLSNRRIWKVDIIKTYKKLIEESLDLTEMIEQEIERRT